MADVRNSITGGTFPGLVVQAQNMTLHQQCWQWPRLDTLPRGGMLVGREPELAGLLDLLRPGGSAAGVAVLSGLAGAGKTALAVAAGHRAREQRWFDGEVFLELHGYAEDPAARVTPSQALGTLLRLLQVPGESIPADRAGREALYRSALGELARAERPLLIVLDDASSAEQIAPLLPPDPIHRVLVTSRHTLAELDGARLSELGSLGREGAVHLLDAVLRAANPDDTRIAADPDAAAELAAHCALLPLALRVTGALLASEEDCTVAELAHQLADEKGRLDQLEYGTGPAVRAAFELSYRHLTAEQARLFCLLSLAPGTHVSAEAAAALADLGAGPVRRGLQGLRRAHVLEPVVIGEADRETAEVSRGSHRFHDLVRLFATECAERDLTPTERDAAVVRLLEYYLATVQTTKGRLGYSAPVERASRFAGHGHALARLDAECANLVGAVPLAAASGHDEICRDLAMALDDHLRYRGHWSDLIDSQEQARRAAGRLGDRLGESVALSSLGAGHLRLGRLDQAVRCTEAALAIQEELGNRRVVAFSLSTLGDVELRSRRFDRAAEYFTRAVGVYRELGAEHGAASVLLSLVEVHREIGRLADALTHCRAALAVFHRVGDRIREAGALSHLGVILLDLGRLREAQESMTSSLALEEEFRDELGVGQTCNNLAVVHARLGEFEESARYARRALDVARARSDRDLEGRALLGLARAGAGLEPDDVVALLREALAAFEDTGEVALAATVRSLLDGPGKPLADALREC